MAKELQQELFSSREREVKRTPVMDNRMVCAIQPFLDRGNGWVPQVAAIPMARVAKLLGSRLSKQRTITAQKDTA